MSERGVLRIYKSYMFRNKDPVIDKLRTMVQDSGKTYRDVEQDSDVSAHTLWGWFRGEIKRPRYCTVAAVADALGYEIEYRPKRDVGIGHNSRAARLSRRRGAH